MKSASDDISTDLRDRWAAAHLKPLWEVDLSELKQQPSEPGFIWKWNTVQPLLAAIAGQTSTSLVERRVMLNVGPRAQGGEYMTTGLVNAAYQYLLPGEKARPHRHSMSALRFVIQGSNAQTIVDGKVCEMQFGDLVLTPAWTWHEHRNQGADPAIWVDVVDDYFHRALGTQDFEPGPVHDIPEQYDDSGFHAPCLVPQLSTQWTRPYSPMFRYPWADVVRTLSAISPGRDGSRVIRYTNPVDGGACVGLFDCHAVQLELGRETLACRSSASALAVVVEGEGASTIDATPVTWGPGDVFSLPQHCWISHTALQGRARLFTVSNREAYRRLGLLREDFRP